MQLMCYSSSSLITTLHDGCGLRLYMSRLTCLGLISLVLMALESRVVYHMDSAISNDAPIGYPSAHISPLTFADPVENMFEQNPREPQALHGQMLPLCTHPFTHMKMLSRALTRHPRRPANPSLITTKVYLRHTPMC